MKVVSYLKSVPERNSNQQKTLLLEKFITGVNKHNDIGILHKKSDIVSSDVAVIQGWVHQDASSPHLKLRQGIIRQQKNNNKYVVVADANLFLFADQSNRHGYLRYSFNGVFPDTGIYCDNHIDPKRWSTISRDLNIKLHPLTQRGKHIVLCAQRNGGWSMGPYHVVDWIVDTVKQIRNHSDRPIIIRPHPGDKKASQYLTMNNARLRNLKNVRLSTPGNSLDKDLNSAYAVVNHNSSSIVGPIIKGYHAFITDKEKSQCSDVAHTDFSYLEKPFEFDREAWLQRISMFHWKFDELDNGSCWSHMRNYCQ